MLILNFFLVFTGYLTVLFDQIVANAMDSEIDHLAYELMSEIRNQNSSISLSCVDDLNNILKSVNRQEMWAVKGKPVIYSLVHKETKFPFAVIDASGTYRSNFVWGENAWLGSKLQCDFLNSSPKFTTSPDIPKLMDEHLINTTSPIEMEYKMIFMIIYSPYKIDPLIRLRVRVQIV